MTAIRPGTASDIARVEEIYDAIHTAEEAGTVSIGWVRGVYPTRATAQAALDAGELFVLADGGTVYAAGRINHEQVPVYAAVPWQYEARPEQVLVLHTLVVDPAAAGHGRTRAAGQIQHDQAQHQADSRPAHERLLPREGIRRLRGHTGLVHNDQLRRADDQLSYVRIVCNHRLQHRVALRGVRSGHAQGAEVRVLLRDCVDGWQDRQTRVGAHGAVEQAAREDIGKGLGDLRRRRRAVSGAALCRALDIDQEGNRGRILRVIRQTGIAAEHGAARHDQHQTQPPQAAKAARKHGQQVAGAHGILLFLFVHCSPSACAFAP